MTLLLYMYVLGLELHLKEAFHHFSQQIYRSLYTPGGLFGFISQWWTQRGGGAVGAPPPQKKNMHAPRTPLEHINNSCSV